ncbi:DedA family protein [Endozoicomonas sp.]|uniref:DedA family protein n=1 Tax=Endozoicomonas sp. TaxID=1892382 RepID=UPI0028886C3C|nr:VTT domain-containing protein [Endozoicomonas sp.]
MAELILNVTNHPLILAGLILLSTYLLEDAAIISAALISIDGFISPELAFLALFIGIFTGDVGLYGLGRLLGKWSWLDKIIPSEKVNKAGEWLKQRMVWTILTVRLIPGLRLPSYVACGFFQYSLMYFSGWVFLASLVWTGVVFTGIYWFGSMFWSELSPFKWLLLPAMVVLILVLHKSVKPSVDA